MVMFSVDGLEWPWPCDVRRVAEVRSSRISGLMLDRSWFNDVLGTYMRYSVEIAVPVDRRNDYALLYETLTGPVDGHAFVLPCNQGSLQITGRVEQVEDVYVRLPGGGVDWRGVRFTVIANHPSRQLSLGQALERGRAPLPPLAAPDEGDQYVFSNGAWTRAEVYAEADGRRY